MKNIDFSLVVNGRIDRVFDWLTAARFVNHSNEVSNAKRDCSVRPLHPNPPPFVPQGEGSWIEVRNGFIFASHLRSSGYGDTSIHQTASGRAEMKWPKSGSEDAAFLG